jgi:phosphoglycolate phosphatase-like HAD superfamily hydrolase
MIVALDFDGVIMDGINECMLVAWNVFNNKLFSDFNNKSLNEIPDYFVDIFTHARNFVRHDGHFIIPFYANKNEVIDSKSFHEIYENIHDADKSKFRDDFVNYRNKVKELFPEYWISLHKELIDLKEIIDLDVDLRIVSGKDAESIIFLLKNKKIHIEPRKVHGRMVEKDTVLKSIKNDSENDNEDLFFVDDNLNNVIDASKLGIQSLWAFWGFHTPEQVQNADRLSIKAIFNNQELLDFIKISKKNEVRI